MQDAVKGFVARRKTNGLFLVDMPTGSGKTYSTIQLIKDYIEGKVFPEIKKVIYLTPLNKNVKDAYEQLRSFLPSELFNKNVLWIQSNTQNVIDHLHEIKDEIDPDIKKKESYMALVGYINSLKAISELNEGDFSRMSQAKKGFEEEIRRRLEPAFRRDIESELNKRARTKKDKLKFIKEKWPWMLTLYPAILTDYRRILFMSVDKFCAGNDPIISKSYGFMTASWVKGSLIFIDEIDAAKEFILRSQIEEADKNRIDIFRLFSTLTASFASERKFPKENFPKPINGDGSGRSSLIAFEKMKAILLERRESAHLDYPFKLDGESNDGERTFLFQDHALHTISSKTSERGLVVRPDPGRGQNVIRFVDQEKEGDGSFYSMIYGFNGALRFTVTCFVLMAQNYLEYYNNLKREKTDDLMEPEQAVTTMLAPFELDDKLNESLKTMIMNDFMFPFASRQRNSLTHDFYMEGFRYFDFVDDRSHDTITSVGMCSLGETPEKFLFQLSSQALVVGLSATATIDTVTGNFNLRYIKERLGEGYCEPTESDRIRLQKTNEAREGAKKYPINVSVITSEGESLDDLTKTVFEQLDNQQVLLAQLQRVVKDNGNHFGQRRIVRVLKAIKNFLRDERGRAMLILTNNNLKMVEAAPYSLPVMKELVRRLASENGNSAEVEIHILYGNTFEQEKNAYKRDLRQGKRVLLFSSYPSAGTGQNLQYEIFEEGSADFALQKDIDSLYLEKPTNILVNVNPTYDEDVWLTDKDLIKYLYQVESLRLEGEVDIKKALNMAQCGFRAKMKAKSKPIQPGTEYKTDSVNNHIIRTLEQAVGRICRTKDIEKPAVAIYLDEDIYSSVNFSKVLEKPMNQEFFEIIKKASNQTELPSDASRQLRKGAEKSQRLEQRLNAMMNERKVSWTEQEMADWTKTREFLLQNPTIDGDIPGAMRDLYFSAEFNGYFVTSYYYRPERHEFGISYIRDQKFTVEASAMASNLTALMRIPEVFAYFSDRKYATTWKPRKNILVPVAFVNLYEGALGEEAGRAILEKRGGLALMEITDGYKFEKFDFCLADDPDIYIDFKNWSQLNSMDQKEERQHILDKLHRIGGKKAYIINIVYDGSLPSHDTGEIYECPGIVIQKNSSQLWINEIELTKLIMNIKEVVAHGNH